MAHGITEAGVKVGDIVKYEDICNNSTFVVTAISDCPWSTFEVVNVDTFEKTTTDGRQRGWSVVKQHDGETHVCKTVNGVRI